MPAENALLYNGAMGNDRAYAHNRSTALAEFAAYLSGSEQALFLVVHDQELSEHARSAITSAAQAREWGSSDIAWLQVDRAQPALGPEQLISAIEGLDPLCAVVAGHGSLSLFAKAYRIERPEQGFAHILGRPTCLLPNIEALLGTNEGKQKAWSIMKALPTG